MNEANQKFIGRRPAGLFKGAPALKLLWLLWVGLLAGSAGAAAANTVRLPGHVPAAVSQLTPLGALPATNKLRLAISLPLRNQAALSDLIKQIYDPASPQYHHYLTPAQFAAQFGPTAADYQTVANYARSNGLAVVGTYPNRLVLDVNAKVSDIQRTFNLTLRTYTNTTEARAFYAPDTDPTVDATLPILHISGLDNYSIPHPKSHFVPSSSAAGTQKGAITAPKDITPNVGSGPGGAYLGTDFRKAYVPGTTLTGAGQNVGLLQFDGFYASDIAAYKSLIGMVGGPQTVVVPVDGGVSTPGGGNVEVCLDIEMVLAMSPGVSKIYVYEAPNPSPWVDLLSAMAANTTVNQFSCSWGGGPPDAAAEQIFQQMALQGQSFFDASGDSCAFVPGTNSVTFPADSTNITQVGGTTLTTGANAAYASEKVWNWGPGQDGVGSCGGISPNYGIPYWQTNISMAANHGSTTMRNIPDVALTADNVYITADGGGSGTVGGTSCAAPLWAAFTALVNQQGAYTSRPSVGFLNPSLYSIARTNYSACFNDTTNGNNYWSGSLTNFRAVPGYDLCTGLGTPKGMNLINTLAPLPVWIGGTNTSGPYNDNFLNAAPISGVSGTIAGSNVGATLEDNIPFPNEPDFINTDDYAGVDKSIWYAWTAPASGTVTFDTFGSDFDTVLAVYLPLPGIKFLVAGNDDYIPSLVVQSRLTFTAVAGTTYFISVNGNSSPAPSYSDQGNVVLNWSEIVPTIPSGTFGFTASSYTVADTDSGFATDPKLLFSALGARVTVTRSGGFSGRVHVPYTIAGDATQIATGANTSGELVFDDYQMSSDIVVPVTILPDGNPGSISVVLGTPYLDALESSDLIAPATNPSYAATTVNVYSDFYSSQTGTNAPAYFNIERSTFRVPENYGTVTIYVSPSQAAPSNTSYSVDYSIDPGPSVLNFWALQAGSDYATPGKDFNVGGTGTLNWPAGDNKPKAITITITDDNIVEFNEDMLITLVNPIWNTNGQAIKQAVGYIGAAYLTILGDDQPAGAVDRNWNVEGTSVSVPPNLTYPGTSGGVVDGANGNGGTVYASAEQPDGSLILGGSFNLYDSNPYNHLVRVQPDGYPDLKFLAPPNSGANDSILAVALYPTNSSEYGKILIGGNFTAFNGNSRFHIARLNADGSLDSNFNPGLGLNGPATSLVVQTNGQAVIGGQFTSYNGTNVVNVARVNADGSLDLTFNPGTGPDGGVNAVAVDASGRVIIGGAFDHVAGLVRGGVARLNGDGSLDTTFDPGIGTYNPDTGSTDPVRALAVQANGQLLVGGSFAFVEMTPFNGVARFNADGTVDTAFGTFGATNGTYNLLTGIQDSVNAITLQPDGNILIGGDFQNINQVRRVGIARLYSDGSLDTSFMDTAYNQFAGIINHYHNPDAINTNDYPMGNHRNAVNTIAIEPGTTNVIIGGSFLAVGGGSFDHSSWRSTVGTETDLTGSDTCGIFENARMDVHPRSNVARLVGGGTPGPGNLEFCYGNYSVGKSDGSLYVSLTRTNGSLGIVGAAFSIPPGPAGQPGIAQSPADFTYDNVQPTWNTWYDNPVPGAPGWMYGDGMDGPNYLIALGDSAPGVGPGVELTLFNNGNITGNLNANLALAQPVSTDFFLGGEQIPLGVALGAQQSSALTIIDPNFKPGTFSFSSPTYTVNESATTVTITVTRTNGTHGAVQVGYATANGSAIAPNNYTAVVGALTFADGVTSQTFTVPIVPSTLNQPDKTVYLRLFGITGGGVPGLTNAVLTIVNSVYGAGHVAFASATNGVNENAGSATIVLNRMGASSGTLDVTAITSDGTAVNGINYVGVTNVVHWNSGDALPKSVTIPILHDGLYSPNLTANIRLTNGMSGGRANVYVLGLSALTNSTLIITNVDFPGSVEFTTPSYSVKKYGGYAVIPVIRTGGSAGTLTVDFSTADNTALNGTDYTATNGMLTFTNGQVFQSFQVPITATSASGFAALNLALTNAVAVGSPAWNAQGSPSNAVLNIIDTDNIYEPPGSPDVSYSPLNGFNGPIYGLALQTNNQLIVAGDFTMANGVYRQRVARINDDGTVDASFLLPSSAYGADNVVRALALQPDGRILIGGYFTNVNNVVVNGLARLNYDGSLDSSFNVGAGADNPVLAVAPTVVNGNAAVLVGGSFAHLGGVLANGIGRLTSTGLPDPGFNTGTGANGTVYALAVQPDGRVVIGGDFTMVNNISVSHIARLNTDGSVDLTFTNGVMSDSVRAITIQLDGKILAGGLFTNVVNGANGSVYTNFNHIARLNSADGSPDGGFNPGLGANGAVMSIALQTDGRIVVGGTFTTASGVTRNRITRLNPDGSVDPTINFGVGADSFVSAVAVEESANASFPAGVPDEKIIIGGGFLNYFGEPHLHLARIYGGSIGGSGAFTFSQPEYWANENGTNVVITVQRTGGTSGTNINGLGDIFVNFATTNGGTAVAGTNYLSVVTNLDFPAGEVEETVTIPLLDDQVITPDLTVDLALTPFAPADYGVQPTAVLIITNVDSAISFTAANYQVNKYASNVLNGFAPITINRLGATYGTSTVVFNTLTNGTATAGVDYQAQTNVLVSFAPGTTVQQVNIPIFNGVPDGATTVNLQLTNATGSALYSPSNAVLSILDKTLAKGAFEFSQTNYIVTQNGGSGQTLATITVLRTNGAAGVVSVSYYTVDGTAAGGVNYVPTQGHLTFGDGVLSQTFTVPVINSSVATLALNLSLVLTNATGGAGLISPTDATLTILNTNTGFYFAALTNTAPENSGFVTVTVMRNNMIGTSSVTYGTMDGTAVAGTNYVSVGGVLTFADGQFSTNIIVPLIYDPMVTGDLKFTLGLFNPVGGQLIAPSVTTVIVQDADAGVSFTNATTTVLKNGTNAVLAVVCSNPRVEPVSVSYGTVDGTATNGIDYTATNGTLVFTNGVTTNYITVPILNNQSLEGNVNFSVALTNAVYPGQLLAPGTNVVTIIDSNSGISFSSAAYSVDKTGVQRIINVIRTGYTDSVMSVNFATADGTATAGIDYVATNGVLVFTNGVTSLQFAVTVIDQMAVQPPKTVLLSLSTPTNAIMVAPTNAVLTITDTNAGVIFASASYSFIETTPSATINVVRYNNTSGTNTVYYSTANGPAAAGIGAAVAGVNYVAQNNQALTFYPGITQIPISVPLIYDTNVTGPLQFSVSLTAANGSGALIGTPGVTTVVLQDADAGLSFNTNATSVLKNAGSVLITVNCSNTNAEPVSVHYATRDGSALAGTDYAPTSGTLTFSNGVSSNSFAVPIIYNSTVAGDHVFSVYLSSPTGTGRLVPPTIETVTIVDSNSGLNFSSGTYKVLKTAGGAIITVNRTDNTNSVCAVSFSTTNGTAINGPNYTATNGTLVFTNGVTSQSFAVPIVNTAAVQPDLTVLLSLFNASNAILTQPSAATLTIQDNSGSYVIPAGSQLVTNYTSVTNYDNNLIGPGDMVQVLFAFRDASAVNVTNLTATLLATNGIAVPTSPNGTPTQDYGELDYHGHSVSQPFTFVAQGTNGQQIAATFNLLDGTRAIGQAVFGYTLGMATTVFSNSAAILINDTNAASPYPSVISVSGVGGSLIKATVTLNKFSHTDPHDVSALVVAPAGTNTLIMAHAGQNGYGATNLVIIFDNAATNKLPSTGYITNGTYKPTQIAPPYSFP